LASRRSWGRCTGPLIRPDRTCAPAIINHRLWPRPC